MMPSPFGAVDLNYAFQQNPALYDAYRQSLLSRYPTDAAFQAALTSAIRPDASVAQAVNGAVQSGNLLSKVNDALFEYREIPLSGMEAAISQLSQKLPKIPRVTANDNLTPFQQIFQNVGVPANSNTMKPILDIAENVGKFAIGLQAIEVAGKVLANPTFETASTQFAAITTGIITEALLTPILTAAVGVALGTGLLPATVIAVGTATAVFFASKFVEGHFPAFLDKVQNFAAAGADLATAIAGEASILANEFGDLLHSVGQQAADFVNSSLDFAGSLLDSAASAVVDAAHWAIDTLTWLGNAILNSSPLVLDLDGDGLELISLAASHVQWDIDVDGFTERSGWVKPDDGLLAYDANLNGRIDNSSELFGSSTLDGFSKLSNFDLNHDHFVNADDAIFGKLLVWRDLNSNGISDVGELYTLNELGIVSIDLDADKSSATNAGHKISDVSTYTYRQANGALATRQIADVWFQFDDTLSNFVGEYHFDMRTLSLPHLRGYGSLPALDIAMSIDIEQGGPMLAAVTALNNRSLDELFLRGNDTLADVRNIMLMWANAENIAVNARGSNVDARELAFLEALAAEPFLQRGWNPNPGHLSGIDLQHSFSIALSNVYARLLAQTHAGEIFSGTPAYDITTDTFTGITGLNAASVSHLHDLAVSATDKLAFWQAVVRMVEYGYGTANLSASDRAALSTAISTSEVSLTLTAVVQSLAFQSQIGVNITGDAADNTINGSVGDDTLNGAAGNDVINGGVGADTIDGSAGNDVLNGQLGDDLVRGGFGADRYIYQKGQGFDTFQEQGGGAGDLNDVIVFGSGITLADLTFARRSDTDLEIRIAAGAGGGGIVIENQINSSAHIESLEFADGSTYSLTNRAYITYGTPQGETLFGIQNGALSNDTIYGGAGADTIYSNLNDVDFTSNTLYGEAGDDRLYGARGDDVLDGGEGADYINGGTGADLLIGATGSDTLIGDAGADTYRYNLGDGVDRIIEGSDYAEDRIVFGAGITADMVSLARRTGFGLTITITGGGVIEIQTQFNSGGQSVETLQFADGSTLSLMTQNYTLYGTSAGENLYGVSTGGGGVDIIYGGAGDDMIRASYSGTDTNTNTLYGEAGDDKIYGGGAADLMDGGAGNDLLDAGNGDDSLFGGAGDDYMQGGGGNDTYRYNLGDGADRIFESTAGQDRILFGAGITQGMITLERRSNNSLTVFVAGGGSILIETQFNYGGQTMETLQFADGSTIDLQTRTYVTYGSDAGENIWGINTGGSSIDTIYGGGGDDIISATSQGAETNANTLYGEAGNDKLYGSSGTDLLLGGAGNDLLDGGLGIDTASYADAAAGVTVSLALTTAQNTGGAGTDTLTAIENLTGSAFDDRLTGNSAVNVLRGGLGNDVLDGGAGADTAVFGFARAAAAIVTYDGALYIGGADREGGDRLVSIESVQFIDQTASTAALSAPVFRALDYIAGYNDLIQALSTNAQGGLSHYLSYGFSEGRIADAFDGYQYIAGYNDLITGIGANEDAAVRHFIQNGFAEGRLRDNFDALSYLASNADLLQAFGANEALAARHFVGYGYAEGRSRDAFDELRYIGSNPDLLLAFGTDGAAAIRHYVAYGYAEGRSTTSFNPLEYIASNADLLLAFGTDIRSAEIHYIQNGFAEHRATTSFNASQYLANYGDLNAAFGSNLDAARTHYIAFGFAEGRTDRVLPGHAPADPDGDFATAYDPTATNEMLMVLYAPPATTEWSVAA